jgi:hypothetical protein
MSRKDLTIKQLGKTKSEMLKYLTDVCSKKRGIPFISKDQSKRGDDIAAATSNLQTNAWPLLQKVHLVGQQRIDQGERVITGLIHIWVSGYKPDGRTSTTRRCNLP